MDEQETKIVKNFLIQMIFSKHGFAGFLIALLTTCSALYFRDFALSSDSGAGVIMDRLQMDETTIRANTIMTNENRIEIIQLQTQYAIQSDLLNQCLVSEKIEK